MNPSDEPTPSPRIPPKWFVWLALTLPFLHSVFHALSSFMGWPCP